MPAPLTTRPGRPARPAGRPPHTEEHPISPHAKAILTALLASGQPMGGSDLIRATATSPGRFYGAIAALEADHLIVGEYEPDVGTRTPRRLFTLTKPGRDYARRLTTRGSS